MYQKFVFFLFFLSFIVEMWKYKNIDPQCTLKKEKK